MSPLSLSLSLCPWGKSPTVISECPLSSFLPFFQMACETGSDPACPPLCRPVWPAAFQAALFDTCLCSARQGNNQSGCERVVTQPNTPTANRILAFTSRRDWLGELSK